MSNLGNNSLSTSSTNIELRSSKSSGVFFCFILALVGRIDAIGVKVKTRYKKSLFYSSLRLPPMSAMNLVQHPYLTNGLVKIMTKAINFGGAWKIHPFYWNETTRLLELQQTIAAKLGQCFCAAFVLFNILSICVRISLANFDTSLEKLLGIFTCIHLAFPIMFYAGLWGHNAAFCSFVNHGVQLMNEFDQHTPNFYNRRQALNIKLLEYGLAVAAMGLLVVNGFFCIVNVLNPKFVMFFSSSLSNPYGNLPLLAVSVLITAIDEFILVAMIYLVVFPAFIVTFPMIRAIVNLKSSSRHPQKFLSCYKQLYLMFVEVNTIYSPILLPATQFFAIILCTLGFVSPFVLPGLLGYAMANIGGIVYIHMVIIFRYLSEFHIRADNLIVFWKRYQVLQPRVLKTLRPVQIRSGSWGYLDPGIILTQTHIIVGNTISLLLLKRA